MIPGRLLMALVLFAAGITLGIVVATLPAMAVESAAGKKDPARAVTSQLICPCSCGEILSGCVCETGKTMQGFVSDELRAGKSKDQITASLVSKYGEVILGAPKAEGFNLVVWIAPFVATLLGFLIAGFVLRRWVQRRATHVLATAGPGSPGFPGSAAAPGSSAFPADVKALRAKAEEELRSLGE
jgi:cytochrome c-type biogenesis protein CcmH/NrfF